MRGRGQDYVILRISGVETQLAVGNLEYLSAFSFDKRRRLAVHAEGRRKGTVISVRESVRCRGATFARRSRYARNVAESDFGERLCSCKQLQMDVRSTARRIVKQCRLLMDSGSWSEDSRFIVITSVLADI